MQICRICLATNRKMFPISDRVHIYEQTTGLSFSSEDCLPKYVCWECEYYMSKYVAFKSRAVRSYHTLIEILNKDGLITESSIKNCNQSTLTPINTLCLYVQEDYDNLIIYDNCDKTAYIKDELIKDFEDESLIKDETLLSDDLIVSSPNIEGADSFRENSSVEKQTTTKLTCVKRKDKASKIIISKDKKNPSEKSKKSNKITKLVGVKRKVCTVKEKKDVKLSINELDKELLLITELTLDEQIAEMQKRKESDNYLNSPHTCDNCFKGFHDFAAYKRHITRYSESRGPHACPVCRMRFRRHFSLNHHMRHHTYKISCSQCNFSTSYIAAAKHHQNYHQGKTYECPHCKDVFSHKSTYLGHLRIKHPSDITCKHCGYTFLNERGLKYHMFRNHRDEQIPADGPVCARCDLRFSCQDALDTHRRVSARHADERTAGVVKPGRNSIPKVYPKFRCGNGKTRKRVVSSEPFPDGAKACELCEKLLPSPKAYVVHFKSAHQGNKPQQNQSKMCEICGKLCQSAILLRHHLYKHSSTKDFKCDRCGKLFQSYSSMYQHKRSHCGDRVDHPCGVCGKTLSSKTNLRRHMEVHKGLSFECDFCGKVFGSQDNRKQHVEHVHKKKPWVRRSRGPRGQAERPPETVVQSVARMEYTVYE